MVWYGTAPHSTVQQTTPQHSTRQCGAVLHGAARRGAVRYIAAGGGVWSGSLEVARRAEPIETATEAAEALQRSKQVVRDDPQI